MNNKSTEETGEVQAEVISTHDQHFQHAFCDKLIAESFFKEYLPAEVKSKLDFKSLEIVKDSFVDETLCRFFSDILYKIKFSGNPAYIYLLLDHKSLQDHWVGFQMLKYMVRIWDLHFKQNKKRRYLPVIIPMVIYHGKPQWKPDNNFVSLFRETEGLEAYIPHFNYMLYDISHIPDDDIRGTNLLRIILLGFKYISSEEMKDKLPEILKLFSELPDKTRYLEYLEAFLTYLTSSAKKMEIEEIQEYVVRYLEDGGQVMQTIAQKLIEQGKKEGVLIGKKEGKIEGKMEAVSKALENNIPIEVISIFSGLSPEEIRQYKAGMKKKSIRTN